MTTSWHAEYQLRGVPPSFRHWQQRCHNLGIPPAIAVSGSRGKSTIVRLLQAIFDEAGIQCAIWTDFGVEINGRRQRGEIAGWNRALARLTESSLDIAIQELDWNLIAAVGLPNATYPIGIITNLCSNDAACVQTPAGHVATHALPRIARAIHESGVICLNGEDFTLQPAASAASAHLSIAARSVLSPMLRQNEDTGAPNFWINDHDVIVCGSDRHHQTICSIDDIPLSLSGTASFEVMNVLLATAAALSTGIGIKLIAGALQTFVLSPDELPGSFNVATKGSIRTVIDHITPSWFLKPVLRAANPQSARRQITVVGGLQTIPDNDVYNVGRLLGRTHGAVICFGDAPDVALANFKRGISSNNYPPVFVQLPTERRAINKAMQALRSDDVVLFLTDSDPGPAIRAVARMRGK
ncbi:MAG: Mur ligase family protein [Thermomicrobiales bacterium]